MADATFDKALTSDAGDWDHEDNVFSITAKAILSDMGAFAFIKDAARKTGIQSSGFLDPRWLRIPLHLKSSPKISAGQE